MASVNGVLPSDVRSAVLEARILVVGAGGIGCELLKDLVLAGFNQIHIIDLDTIDVSNLNRQFLFHKEHVGKSKAEVAKVSALNFANADITAYHDSITSNEYGVNFFKSFSLVLNALDNRAARNHVNRMCLAADVPLIESGTAGYAGQVELIKKPLTQCYECQPKSTQKSFPGCTIRNTPSEPIHCIVWAKHLFNQLFGEEDPDQDVSPDTEDPEAAGDAGERALDSGTTNNQGNVERTSTRTWARSCGYDPAKLFAKLFHDDILYLLSMHNLWKTRRAPTPLEYNNLPDAVAGSSNSVSSDSGLKEQRIWSMAECARVFADSCCALKDSLASLESGDHLVWDKDDKSAMDFVAACANVRSYIFGIDQKSRFDIKSMAGNIIPAIATTNAIVSGIAVMHAFNVLMKQYQNCQSVYLRLKPNHRGQLFVPERGLIPPNPKCYVCSPKPSVVLICDTGKLTCNELNGEILIGKLNMVAPDAFVEGQSIILISSEEGETEENMPKTLQDLGVKDGSVLLVDDYHQDYQLRVIINHNAEAKEYELVADLESLKPQENSNGNGTSKDVKEPSASTSKPPESDDSDMEIIDEEESPSAPKKRKIADQPNDVPQKKARTSTSDDIQIVDLC